MTYKHRLFDLNHTLLELKGETYVPHLPTN
ncbi:Uncharacterised protein [uncultured Streptococcus sp.]|nr:Uncharacterised protein [uncultured Streptococcus sp.]